MPSGLYTCITKFTPHFLLGVLLTFRDLAENIVCMRNGWLAGLAVDGWLVVNWLHLHCYIPLCHQDTFFQLSP